MIDGERWLPVVGFEALYQVSNHGRVMRIADGKNTCAGKVLKPTLRGQGKYFSVALVKDRIVYQRYVHRLVAIAFLGPEPYGHEVNHKDGNKQNPRADNLEYVTRSGNVRHAISIGNVKTGQDSPMWRGGPKPRPKKPPQVGDNHWARKKPHLIAHGENSGKNKLTAAQVADIRRRVDNGEVQRHLAAEYKIGAAQVCRIIKGVRWAR